MKPIPEHWQVLIAASGAGFVLIFGLWILTELHMIDWTPVTEPKCIKNMFGNCDD